MVEETIKVDNEIIKIPGILHVSKFVNAAVMVKYKGELDRLKEKYESLSPEDKKKFVENILSKDQDNSKRIAKLVIGYIQKE